MLAAVDCKTERNELTVTSFVLVGTDCEAERNELTVKFAVLALLVVVSIK